MNLFNFISNKGADCALIDRAPVQMNGDVADEIRAQRQKKVDALKVKMGSRYLLANSQSRIAHD